MRSNDAYLRPTAVKHEINAVEHIAVANEATTLAASQAGTGTEDYRVFGSGRRYFFDRSTSNDQATSSWPPKPKNRSEPTTLRFQALV